MEGSISLGRAERKRLLELYRKHPDPAVRKSGHMVLLLADGHPWSLIVTVLYCSTRTIARRKERTKQVGWRPCLVSGGVVRRPSDLGWSGQRCGGSPRSCHGTSASCAAGGVASWWSS